MIRRLIIAILVFALVIGLVTGLIWIYWINVIAPPGHFEHPAVTSQQRYMLKKARMKYGNYRIERVGVEGRFIIYFKNEYPIQLGGEV